MNLCNFGIPIRQQISDEEKDSLMHLMKLHGDCKMVLEIGAWVGDSTSTLATFARGMSGVVYVVDHFLGNPGTHLAPVADEVDIYDQFRNNMFRLGLDDMVKVLKMSSMEASQIIADQTFDFIFLDADHTYDHVIYDLTAWYPKLKTGGIFVGHDYDSHDGTYDEAYIHRDSVNGKHNGLIKAVNEYFGSANISMEAGSIWWVRKQV